MRNRRITLMILVALTILAGLDLRFGVIGSAEQEFGRLKFNITYNDNNSYPSHTKTEVLTMSAADLAELAVVSKEGMINVYGIDTDQITITGKITVSAVNQEDAQNYAEALELQLKQAADRAELSLLEAERPKAVKSVKTSYEITMPKHLDLAIDAEYNQISLADLTGAVALSAGFSSVQTKNLSGSVDGTFDFTNTEFENFGGSLSSEHNFSNLVLNLDGNSSGYTFDVEVNFGKLGGNVKLDQAADENEFTALGQVGDGKNQITIGAHFSNVDINLR